MFPAFFNRNKNKPYITEGNRLFCDDIDIPIKDGIRYFAATDSYASLFGDQWKAYKKTQLDSYSGVPISENRMRRSFGDLYKNLKGKVVLEAGCGAGRFSEILLKQGAQLVSSDLSNAVEVNQENFPQDENHMVIQADINDMPYADESFDVVVCIGVIQHTPNSEQTIESLYKLVKKGGYLIIDHYTYNKSNYLRAAPLYRNILKKKSAEETIPYTQRLVNRYLPWHRRFSKNRLLSIILNRVSPVISYYRAFPQLNDKQQEEWAMLDTHDSLTDWHKNFRNKTQITALLEKLKATEIWCEFNGNFTEAKCRKPA
ncbi:MAG: methyltransferase domain-containing protein [Ferruginibacter sp.]